jgi:ribonuclease HI
MLVTIITDASHCSDTLAAGYGYWIKSSRGSNGGSGMFKVTVPDAMVAETMAIVNGIHLAIALDLAAAGDDILVQTDCQGAIHCLDRTMSKEPRETLMAVRNKFDRMREEYRLNVTFRHVKGHTRVQDSRSRAQRNADAKAKAAMRKKRTALRRAARLQEQVNDSTR